MSALRRAPALPRLIDGQAQQGPVLLATLGVPLDPDAAALAVDAAVEAGRGLVVANVVELPPLAMSVRLGYDQLDDPQTVESLRVPAELARSLGVDVQRLRVRSPRPVAALLELARERRPCLLVFGPARAALSPRVYRRAVRALRAEAACLLWIAE
jgi:hypothetical protein